MKTRTNQPIFLDNGEKVDDGKLGGTQLYLHTISFNMGGGQPAMLKFVNDNPNAETSSVQNYVLNRNKVLFSLNNGPVFAYWEIKTMLLTSTTYVINYDGGTNKYYLETYTADTIDLTDGSINSRTPSSSVQVVSFTDVVTAL